MPEKPNERLARHIVSVTLGVPVERFEDGRRPAQVDAVIDYGHTSAALEIVADHEPEFNKQWSALEKINFRVEVAGLRRVWSAQLARTAKVKRVEQQLPDLLLDWERRTSGNDVPRHRRALPEEFAALGVTLLYPLDDVNRSGYVNLHAAGWSGFAGSESLAHYVDRILEEHHDVPRKLAAHGAAESHAFIWTTIGTVWGVQSQLERREQPLPTDDPELPEGVTHVWVAGSFNSQGTLAWFPDRGWWRVPFEWPDDGTLVLDN